MNQIMTTASTRKTGFCYHNVGSSLQQGLFSTSLKDDDSPTTSSSRSSSSAGGLYRKFATHALDKLRASGWFQDKPLPKDLEFQQAPAKGMPNAHVQITTTALIPKEDGDDDDDDDSSSNNNKKNNKSLVRYARVALLETIVVADNENNNNNAVEKNDNTAGIQVLNLVVIPSETTTLPVLGIDLVSLPGNRHLLLLDAQPMTSENPFDEDWKEWYETHVVPNQESIFPWGGDFPEAVQPYVSPYSLWTRLQEVEDPVTVIQTHVWDAFVHHLDIYLNLLEKSHNNNNLEGIQGTNHQAAYLEYRRNNDPAKPMLNSLYGAEWTDRVLDEVLFLQQQQQQQ